MISSKFSIGQVLLRDPSDDNVTPVVEELKRRLKPMNANREDQREEKDSKRTENGVINEDRIERDSSCSCDLGNECERK